MRSTYFPQSRWSLKTLKALPGSRFVLFWTSFKVVPRVETKERTEEKQNFTYSTANISDESGGNEHVKEGHPGDAAQVAVRSEYPDLVCYFHGINKLEQPIGKIACTWLGDW